MYSQHSQKQHLSFCSCCPPVLNCVMFRCLFCVLLQVFCVFQLGASLYNYLLYILQQIASKQEKLIFAKMIFCDAG